MTKPTVGRIVLYCLASHDANWVNDQCEGNHVYSGDYAPMMISAVNDDNTVNGQVFADAHATLHAQNVSEETERNTGVGTWHWPMTVDRAVKDAPSADPINIFDAPTKDGL